MHGVYSLLSWLYPEHVQFVGLALSNLPNHFPFSASRHHSSQSMPVAKLRSVAVMEFSPAALAHTFLATFCPILKKSKARNKRNSLSGYCSRSSSSATKTLVQYKNHGYQG
ncbi:hypothetical protein PS1_027651 [Malus domestica]